MKYQRICLASLFLSVNLVSAVAAQTFELTNILSFDGTNGAEPWCKLIRGRDGLLYGTTYSGGNNAGTIFKMTPFGKLTTMYAFGFSTGGFYPGAGLVEASDGNFYGTTTDGGMNSSISPYGTSGLIYRITPTGEFTNLYQFSGPDGANPWAGPLVQGRDGFLYGTTSDGGSGDFPGSIFQISTNGFFNSLCGLYGDDGLRPYGGLVEGSDGNFYGTSQSGLPLVFRLTRDGAYSILAVFPADGMFAPNLGSLLAGNDGALYGTTLGLSGPGVPNISGTVFKLTLGGQITTLAQLEVEPMLQFQGRDGRFYGTTSGSLFLFSGQEAGTVFAMTAQGQVSTLFDFGDGASGVWPNRLIEMQDGSIVGTTLGIDSQFSGSADYGSVFRLTPDGAVNTLLHFDPAYPFNGPVLLSQPSALVEEFHGVVYGATLFGGTASAGSVFKVEEGHTTPW